MTGKCFSLTNQPADLTLLHFAGLQVMLQADFVTHGKTLAEHFLVPVLREINAVLT